MLQKSKSCEIIATIFLSKNVDNYFLYFSTRKRVRPAKKPHNSPRIMARIRSMPNKPATNPMEPPRIKPRTAQSDRMDLVFSGIDFPEHLNIIDDFVSVVVHLPLIIHNHV